MTLAQTHLMLACFWLGLLAAETVLELCGREAASLRVVARAHRWIDMFFEIPVALAVLASGLVLLCRLWPAPSLMLIHAAVGTIPVAVNLVCTAWIHARASESADDSRVAELTRRVKLTGLAIPLVVLALVIGISFMPAL